jgi:septal ring factor EnvC (AmiA/AmiB activator)
MAVRQDRDKYCTFEREMATADSAAAVALLDEEKLRKEQKKAEKRFKKEQKKAEKERKKAEKKLKKETKKRKKKEQSDESAQVVPVVRDFPSYSVSLLQG